MQRLSALFYSNNDIEHLMDAIRRIYREADEVVVVDSSNTENLASLRGHIKQKRLEKVRVFNVCDLGYAEMKSMYGVSKCRCDWVLQLCATETVNEEFRKSIRRIIESTDSDGFLINRRELDKDGKLMYIYCDVRLFKRSKASSKGYIGEGTAVNGRVEMLPAAYAINHDTRYDRSTIKTYLGFTIRTHLSISYKHIQEYMMIERLQHRVTYGSLLQKTGSAFVRSALRGYFFLKGVKPDAELTGEDYRLMFATYHIAIFSKQILNGMKNFNLIRSRLAYDEIKVRAFLDGPAYERELELGIQKDIEKHGGIIKYMNLDTDYGWRLAGLSSKRLKLRGSALLLELLKEKHAASLS
jgi:hypothetical protein